MAAESGVCEYFTVPSVPPRNSTPKGTGDPVVTQRWPIEMIPATLKISENVRKYHFFPRKSMFVSLKNSTLLTIPSKSVVGSQSFVVRDASFEWEPRTTID